MTVVPVLASFPVFVLADCFLDRPKAVRTVPVKA
jgi:hypothetical protein